MKPNKKILAISGGIILAAVIIGVISYTSADNLDNSPEALQIKTSYDFKASVKQYVDESFAYNVQKNTEIKIIKIYSPDKVDIQLKVSYEFKGHQEATLKGTWVKENGVWQPTKVKTVSQTTNNLPIPDIPLP